MCPDSVLTDSCFIIIFEATVLLQSAAKENYFGGLTNNIHNPGIYTWTWSRDI